MVLVAGTLALAIQTPDVAMAGSPIGGPFLVGDEDVPTASPAVAYNSIWDEYLVVWQNDRPGFDDIYAQLVSEDGDLVGGRRVITWGADTERRYPDVAYNPNWNEYLVVWEHYDHATGSFSIRGQRVSWEGEPTGGEILISSGGPVSGWQPKVAHAFTSGMFLVVWESHTQGGVSNDVKGQLIANGGGLVGGNFDVALGDWSFSHEQPDLAYNRGSNEFLVAWQQEDKNASLYDVYARIVRPDGSMPPSTIEIARYTAHSTAPAVGAIPAAIPGGQYLVAWELQYGPSNRNIMARFVKGDGSTPGPGFYVCSRGDDEVRPAVAGNERSASYLVSWTQSMGWSNINGQEIAAGGALTGPNRVLAGKYADNAAVSDGSLGDFLVAYDDQPYTANRDTWGYLWGNRVYLPFVTRNG